MAEIKIRAALPEHMKYVREMIQELADFEKMPDGPKISTEDLIKDGFGENPLFRCFIAEVSDPRDVNKKIPVCYALTYTSYSTWEGRSLFLEDLYVKLEYRNKGVGREMIKYLAKIALSEGSSRLDLHVLDWNPARKFYEKLGFTNLTEKEGWMFCRLTSEEMEKM